MRNVFNPRAVAAGLTELWSPRVVGEVDDHYVKVAKIQGDLDWHSHADEDELFFVLQGKLRLEFEDGLIELDEGDCHVVPRGIRHHPVAERECLVLLFERKSTKHTGDVVGDRTRSIEEQLRPIG
jgi:mannose-6-phosphate isomerase-like protein (cupin superfamily)